MGAAHPLALPPPAESAREGDGAGDRRGGRFFLEDPDRSRRHVPEPGARRRTADALDSLSEFARAFPAWIETRGPHRGYPISWGHYRAGMRHLTRAAANEKLRLADSFRAAQAQKEEAAQFFRMHYDLGSS
jgi:hypothetical protein